VAVHPSLSENVGGAVESLLSGIPTIATAVGGLPDLVTNHETGWSVPPRSPALLAEAILAALADPPKAHAMAQAGQERARRLFDVKSTSKQVYQIYHNLIL
jgi:glycosyltransferase involved in cell wall biosynthesis